MKKVQLMAVGAPAPLSPGVLVGEVVPVADPDVPVPFGLIEFSIEPRTASETGSHPLAEIWRVVSGRGRVTTEDDSMEVKAGDLVYLRPNVVHQLENSGDDVLSALSITWKPSA